MRRGGYKQTKDEEGGNGNGEGENAAAAGTEQKAGEGEEIVNEPEVKELPGKILLQFTIFHVVLDISSI